LLPFLAHTKWPFAQAFGESLSVLEQEKDQSARARVQPGGDDVVGEKIDTISDPVTPTATHETEAAVIAPTLAPEATPAEPELPVADAPEKHPVTPSRKSETTAVTEADETPEELAAPVPDAPVSETTPDPVTPSRENETTAAAAVAAAAAATTPQEPVLPVAVAESPTPLASPQPSTPLSDCASPELALEVLMKEDANISAKEALKVRDCKMRFCIVFIVLSSCLNAETQASKARVEEGRCKMIGRADLRVF
jgi:hypothetical protein